MNPIRHFGFGEPPYKTEHHWRNSFWTPIYRRRQRLLLLWSGIAMLVVLLGLLFYPWAIFLSGRFSQ